MEGLTRKPGRIELTKPYLSTKGIDFFGHTVFQKADIPLQLHLHKGCLELVYVMRGEQTYYTENHTYELTGGQAFLSFLDQPHRSGTDFQGVSEIYWIQLNLTQPESFLGFSEEFSYHITDRLAALDRHSFSFDTLCSSCLKQCFQRFLREGTSPEAVSFLMQLLVLTLDCAKAHRPTQNPFSALAQYIESHLSDTITLEDLSRISGFSPSTVSHKFKAHYGHTPGAFISYKKIAKAQELLRGGLSVTETAMALGFNTSDYFSTVFRKYTGKSPTGWLHHETPPLAIQTTPQTLQPT